MTKQLTQTAQLAKDLRTALKNELGLSRKHVSVRTENFSMGSSIDVTVKTLAANLDAVTKIAKRFESVDRCAITGDILAGGNRYVSVDYCSGVLDVAAEPLAGALKVLDQGTVKSVTFQGCRIESDGRRDYFRFVTADGYEGFACDPVHAARRVVSTIASGF